MNSGADLIACQKIIEGKGLSKSDYSDQLLYYWRVWHWRVNGSPCVVSSVLEGMHAKWTPRRCCAAQKGA